MAGERLDQFNVAVLEASPSASWFIAGRGGTAFEFHGGYSLLEPYKIAAGDDTLYDLASLTKPLVTALLALKAHCLGLIDLERPVDAGGGPAFTLLDLLRHEGGFPAWCPLYKLPSKGDAKKYLLGLPRKEAGAEAVYSCPGYILAGFLLEELLGGRLDELFAKFVKGPLSVGEDEALFNPPPRLRERVAGTELDGSFEKEMALKEGAVPPGAPGEGLWGVVHDGNARFLGGVAGNSGLFATLGGTMKLLGAYRGSSLFLVPEVLQLAYRKGRAGFGEHRSAGFKLPGSPGWQTGGALRKGTVAHEGFTGTFAAVSEKEEMMILLTNRIHPSHPRRSFSGERIKFIEAASEMLDDV